MCVYVKSLCVSRAFFFSAASMRSASFRAAAPLRKLVVSGREVRVRQHFMDVPVPQARRRAADLTGLKVWPCSLRLLHHYESDVLPRLLQRRRASGDDAPLRVLELGSGVGALGLGIAAVGGARVVLTDPGVTVNLAADYSSNTLDWLAANVADNEAALRERAPAVRRLVWGDEAHTAALLAEFASPFDLVVGTQRRSADGWTSGSGALAP